MTTLGALRDLLVKEFQLDPSKVREDTPLEDLGVDSLAIAEFIFKLGDVFHVRMPEQGIRPRSVGDVARELDALIAHRPNRSSAAAGP